MKLSALASLLVFCSCTCLAKDSRPNIVEVPHAAPVMVPVGDFDDDSIAPVKAKVQELVDAGEKTVMLMVDSHGGSVDTGIEFNNYLENLQKQGIHITCVVNYKAYSMGAYIMEMGGCQDRWSTPAGQMMFHEGSTEGQGRAKDLEEAAHRLRNLNHSMIVSCSKRMGMTEAAFGAKIEAGNWWMSADEALANHAIDQIKEVSELPPVAALEVGAGNSLAAQLKKLLGQ